MATTESTRGTTQSAAEAITALAGLYTEKFAKEGNCNGKKYRLYVEGDTYKTGEFSLVQRVWEVLLQLIESLGISVGAKGYAGDGKFDLHDKIVGDINGTSIRNVLWADNGVNGEELVKASLALEKVKEKTGSLFQAVSEWLTSKTVEALGQAEFDRIKENVLLGETEDATEDVDSLNGESDQSSTSTPSVWELPGPPGESQFVGSFNLEAAARGEYQNAKLKMGDDTPVEEATISLKAAKELLGYSCNSKRTAIAELIVKPDKLRETFEKLNSTVSLARDAKREEAEFADLKEKFGDDCAARAQKIVQSQADCISLSDSLDEMKREFEATSVIKFSRFGRKSRKEVAAANANRSNLETRIEEREKLLAAFQAELDELKSADEELVKYENPSTRPGAALFEATGLTHEEHYNLCQNFELLVKVANEVEELYESQAAARTQLGILFKRKANYSVSEFSEKKGTLSVLIINAIATGKAFGSGTQIALGKISHQVKSGIK